MFIWWFFISLLVGEQFALDLNYQELSHTSSLDQAHAPASPFLNPIDSSSSSHHNIPESVDHDGKGHNEIDDRSHEESTSATKENNLKSQNVLGEVEPESESVSDEDCAICLTKIEDEADRFKCSACRPKFHRECMKQWLVVHKGTSCPTCRKSMTGPTPQTSSRPTSPNSIGHHGPDRPPLDRPIDRHIDRPPITADTAIQTRRLRQLCATQRPAFARVYGIHQREFDRLFDKHPRLEERLFAMRPSYVEQLIKMRPEVLNKFLIWLFNMNRRHLEGLFHEIPWLLEKLFDLHPSRFERLLDMHPSRFERLLDMHPSHFERLLDMHPGLLELTHTHHWILKELLELAPTRLEWLFSNLSFFEDLLHKDPRRLEELTGLNKMTLLAMATLFRLRRLNR